MKGKKLKLPKTAKMMKLPKRMQTGSSTGTLEAGAPKPASTKKKLRVSAGLARKMPGTAKPTAVKGDLIAERFKIRGEIGCGSFGFVFRAVDLKTRNNVALKFESKAEPNRLQWEEKVYRTVKGTVGFANLVGTYEMPEWRILVVDLLGCSVDTWIKNRKNKANWHFKDIYRIGWETVAVLEQLHKFGFIHRDMKPANMVWGGQRNGRKSVHLIDFGSSRKWKDDSGNHLPHVSIGRVVGSRRYCSVDNHNGLQPTRRDDLESLGYVLLYLGKGTVPWQDISHNTNAWKAVRDVKTKATVDDMCEGLPEVFKNYMRYVKALRPKASPDYTYLRYLWKAAAMDSSAQKPAPGCK